MKKTINRNGGTSHYSGILNAKVGNGLWSGTNNCEGIVGIGKLRSSHSPHNKDEDSLPRTRCPASLIYQAQYYQPILSNVSNKYLKKELVPRTFI